MKAFDVACGVWLDGCSQRNDSCRNHVLGKETKAWRVGAFGKGGSGSLHPEAGRAARPPPQDPPCKAKSRVSVAQQRCQQRQYQHQVPAQGLVLRSHYSLRNVVQASALPCIFYSSRSSVCAARSQVEPLHVSPQHALVVQW